MAPTCGGYVPFRVQCTYRARQPCGPSPVSCIRHSPSFWGPALPPPPPWSTRMSLFSTAPPAWDNRGRQKAPWRPKTMSHTIYLCAVEQPVRPHSRPECPLPSPEEECTQRAETGEERPAAREAAFVPSNGWQQGLSVYVCVRERMSRQKPSRQTAGRERAGVLWL